MAHDMGHIVSHALTLLKFVGNHISLKRLCNAKTARQSLGKYL